MLKVALELATVSLGIAYVFCFVRFWRQEASRIVQESGYAPPIPRLYARLLTCVLSRLTALFAMGPITMRGGARAEKEEKQWRYVAVSNHQIPLDAVIWARMAKLRRWRFMVAMEEVRRPYLAPFYALVGAIPVIRRGSEAGGKVDSATRTAAAAAIGAVKALKADKEAGPQDKGLRSTLALIALAVLSGLLNWWWLSVPASLFSALGVIDLFIKRPTHFAIAPQGRLVSSDELVSEDFHTGPVKIARRLQKETGEQVALLPFHIRYDYDRRSARGWERLLEAIHFPRRFFDYGPIYGAVVTVGDPLPIDSLPRKDDEAALKVYDAIVELKARSHTGRAPSPSPMTPVPPPA